MSYLDPLRLHFAGRFQANVSTVNNDPGHFDNASFKPSYQDMQTRTAMNGWFNPQGDAAWRLLGVKVSSAWTAAGAVDASDPVLACIVADSDGRVPAKLVDLDPEQQLVSEIWGLQVRIAHADGSTLLLADFEPAAFIDIWDRATVSSGGDADAGAMYQSVLRNLRWSDVSASPFLSALKAAASDGLLSIKFNVDGFNLNFQSPDFMTGRIVGSIGPASADEPRHFVLGRQFMAAGNPYALPPANFFQPVGNINFCVARVDAEASLLYLDLGNALLTGANGSLLDLGDLQIEVFVSSAGRAFNIGTLPSQGASGYSSDPDWYARTAGVVVLPIAPKLLAQVQANPLCLSAPLGRINEVAEGGFVRADTYVFRASPGDTVTIDVYASVFGQPAANAVIDFVPDSSQLQPGNFIGGEVPPVATPLAASGFATLASSLTASTGAKGLAQLSLRPTDPGTPRWFGGGTRYGIDGQVYGIRASLQSGADQGPVNPWNFISLLLWSGYKQPATPTWADVQPIFQQYANLYPVMNRFLDMGDFDSVLAHTRLLSLAFGLDPADPNAMPVTRDLSPAKRSTILAWLAKPLPAPATKTSAPPLAVAAAAKADTEASLDSAARGGKAAAAARRLVLQNP
ncbi:hypothetical protein [Aquimonas sp.]|jgi:hypothetical protein|uniref:hypothetical protein n=1 Tax=Aquimonas sp. TaxID=1872588 RepID=UPI0037BFD70F